MFNISEELLAQLTKAEADKHKDPQSFLYGVVFGVKLLMQQQAQVTKRQYTTKQSPTWWKFWE